MTIRLVVDGLTRAQKIAEHVLTILINLAGDPDVLKDLVNDDKFIGVVLDHIVVSLLCPRKSRHDHFITSSARALLMIFSCTTKTRAKKSPMPIY